MRRVSVIASGDVQAVGYREFVRKQTFKKNIGGFVRNLDSGDVEIIAEGSEDDLKKFTNAIQISEYPIDVRDLHVSWHHPTGEFTRFDIIRGDRDQELFERIDVAGTMLYKIMDKTSMSLEKQDQMINMQDLMVNKQDQTLSKQDQMLEKQDQMVTYQADTLKETKGLRSDFETYRESEFSEIKQKLESIIHALERAGIMV